MFHKCYTVITIVLVSVVSFGLVDAQKLDIHTLHNTTGYLGLCRCNFSSCNKDSYKEENIFTENKYIYMYSINTLMLLKYR